MLSLKLAGVHCFPPCCSLKKPTLLPSRSTRDSVSFHRVICTLDQSPAKTERRQANYQPSLWTDDYIQSLPNSSYKVAEADAARIRLLKERTKKLLYAKKEIKDQLELIDVLQQLGVTYHFKAEIKDALLNINRAIAEGTSSPQLKDDLCSMSVLFRLLREQCFAISQDMFECFRDEKGCWEDMRHHTTKAVLSLYEASYLAVEGESSLVEAREVTTKHLKDVLLQGTALDSGLRETVTHALDLPMNWRIQRLHTRWFIEAYQKRPNMDPLLLELAKLDFNAVQRFHREELKQLSGWWNDLGIWQKLPFARDGLAENYFWAMGAAFGPQFSSCREAITKVGCLVTAIDDVFDVYGTLEELQLFTDAVDRWEVDAVKQLPVYMMICFLALFNTTNDMAYQVMKNKGFNVIPYLKRAWADLCKAYMVESKWYHQGYTPKFQEYLDNALVTVGGYVALTFAFCMNNDVSVEDIETFSCNHHDMLLRSSTIFRLCNDLATYTADELERGDVPKSVQCYMHEMDVSEDKARGHIQELIRENWRALNGSIFSLSPSQEYLKDVVINLTRTSHCVYQYGEGLVKHDGETKDPIIALLMEPIFV